MDNLEKINKMWNYSKPAETREKFMQYLEAENPNKELINEINTQIVRTYGLEGQFDKALELCDKIEAEIEKGSVSEVRFNLEKGRVYNSSKKPEIALKYFEIARDLGKKVANDFLVVDAIHMLGIADGDRSLDYNLQAIQYAEQSPDDKAKGWLGSLLNNTGWSYHDLGEYGKALELFEKAYDYFKNKGNQESTRIAKWTVARCLRSLSEVEKALSIQLEILNELDETDTKDGFCHEEIAECLLSLGKNEESKKHFKLAYEQLQDINWLEESRLDRLKELSN